MHRNLYVMYWETFIRFVCIQNIFRGHGGRVVTLSPPTSEAGVRSPSRPYVGKPGSCLPLVGSLQYRTLANSMYWFPLPFQLPVVLKPQINQNIFTIYYGTYNIKYCRNNPQVLMGCI